MASKQIWIHSDWHWRHANIYSFVYTDSAGVQRRVRERFANYAEGDAYMEQRWRDLVKPEHIVYCLGDLTMFRGNHMIHEFVKLFQSLPGHKRLIPGNHDHYKTKIYADAGFEKISGGRLLDGIILSHYPLHPSSLTFKVTGNVHGHTHEKPDISPLHLNVSVERTNFEPVPLEWAAEQLARKRRAIVDARLVDVSGNPIEGP